MWLSMGNLLARVWIKPAYGIKQYKNTWKNKIIYTANTKVKCRSTMELWSYGNLPLKCEIPLWPQKVSPHTDIKKVEKQEGQNLKH